MEGLHDSQGVKCLLESSYQFVCTVCSNVVLLVVLGSCALFSANKFRTCGWMRSEGKVLDDLPWCLRTFRSNT